MNSAFSCWSEGAPTNVPRTGMPPAGLMRSLSIKDDARCVEIAIVFAEGQWCPGLHGGHQDS